MIECSIEFDCFHSYDDLRFDGRTCGMKGRWKLISYTFVKSVARARFFFSE